MSRSRRAPPIRPLSHAVYKRTLEALQVQLVKLQNHVIRKEQKLLVVLEGRDAAGKDGMVKRIVEHLSPRETRVVALPKPNERERSSWYFQRFVPHLPAGGEIVLFNRSWYNRAGVERVMGFCSDHEYDVFMEDAPRFEQLLVRGGTVLRKYYLDVSKREQKRRLRERRHDPLSQWKSSPIDAVATEHWDDYSVARDEMFARTHTAFAPWKVVRADDKRVARIALLKDLLVDLEYKGKDERLVRPDPAVVFEYGEEYLENGAIAP
jgi:polyphosphate kinase 2